jgi:hypothetical protein
MDNQGIMLMDFIFEFGIEESDQAPFITKFYSYGIMKTRPSWKPVVPAIFLAPLAGLFLTFVFSGRILDLLCTILWVFLIYYAQKVGGYLRKTISKSDPVKDKDNLAKLGKELGYFHLFYTPFVPFIVGSQIHGILAILQ